MKEQLESMRSNFSEKLKQVNSNAELEALRVEFLGKKGQLTSILKQMGKLSPEERPVMGQLANEVRGFLEDSLTKRSEQINALETAQRLKAEKIDITMPGKKYTLGHKHPLSIVLDEVKDIFLGMGFSIATGPEVEWDYYNFEALNIPKNHPSRDTQDTFYITENILLRTQTSPVQIRVMEKQLLLSG
jgi:phenylalanyl-tRNA synthetase alpha chain